MFAVLNVSAACSLVGIVAWFAYQDMRTSFGASSTTVFIAGNFLLSWFIGLIVLNLPIYGLLRKAVRLSAKLDGAVSSLKEAQRDLVGVLPLHKYNLFSTLWDGRRFGVDDPIFGFKIDSQLDATLQRLRTVLFFFWLKVQPRSSGLFPCRLLVFVRRSEPFH